MDIIVNEMYEVFKINYAYAWQKSCNANLALSTKLNGSVNEITSKKSRNDEVVLGVWKLRNVCRFYSGKR